MAKEDIATRAARLVALHGKEAATHAVECMRRHALAGDRRKAHEWGSVLSHVRRLLATGGHDGAPGTDATKPPRRESRAGPADPEARRNARPA